MFELQMEEVSVCCRKLHHEALHNLHFSPNMIKVIKSGITWGKEREEQSTTDL
jgi:hypothetical protein